MGWLFILILVAALAFLWRSAARQTAQPPGTAAGSLEGQEAMAAQENVRKPVEGLPDERECFERAYWQGVASVDVSQNRLQAMFSELQATPNSEWDSKPKLDLLSRHLPDGSWRWPAWESYALKRDAAQYQEEVDEVAQYSLADFLSFLKVPALRALCKAHADAGVKPAGRKKTELMDALLTGLPAERRTALHAQLRAECIADIEPPGKMDYREMREVLYRRIVRLARTLQRKAELKAMVGDKVMGDVFSTWVFHARLSHPDTPAACLQRDGARFSHDDPIWEQIVPCDFLLCSCDFGANFDWPSENINRS